MTCLSETEVSNYEYRVMSQLFVAIYFFAL